MSMGSDEAVREDGDSLRWYQWLYGYATVPFYFLLGGWLLERPGWNSGARGAMSRMALIFVRYTVFWSVIACIIWVAEPHFLVSSRNGLQTAFQVLPAIAVAVLVLLLGSVAVIAQMAAATWGTRAPVMLTIDDRFYQAILRPLTLLVAVLLLAGQVPDAPADPSGIVTAAAAALATATGWMAVRSTALPVFVIRAIAPRTFPLYVVEDVARELEGGSTDFVVLRGPLLGEMLKMSLRREDSIAVHATLEAICRMQAQYLDALEVHDSIRSHRDRSEGTARHQWLAEDLTFSLMNASDQALRDLAPSEDANAITRTLGTVAVNFIAAEEYDDAAHAIEGLIAVGTSAHQLTPGGANLHGPPLEALADVEAILEELGDEVPQGPDGQSLTTYALAGWCLVAAYPVFHFGVKRHSLYDATVRRLGPRPEWDGAQEIITSSGWQALWGNKQHKGARPVLRVLRRAKKDHMRRDARR